MKKNNSNWVPEILYEEGSQIPFIEVPKGEADPALLFIFVNRKTGQTEPGPKGEELDVYDMELRQFADMSVLSNKLSPEDYDKVRVALGLEKRTDAVKKGREITKKITANVNGTAE